MARNAKDFKLSPSVWTEIASFLREQYPNGLRNVRIIVPTAAHIGIFREALRSVPGGFSAPKSVTTVIGLLFLQEPDKLIANAVPESRRLMNLYAELRKYDWLKAMFSAKHNPDLFPLAKTLLAMGNELTEALLPAIKADPGVADAKWEAALQQLPEPSRGLLSQESQMVWAIWKAQMDSADEISVRYANSMRVAADANEDLVWISSAPTMPIEEAFLAAYSERNTVTHIGLDWTVAGVSPLLANTWTEMIEGEVIPTEGVETPDRISLISGSNIEDEAQRGAQAILDWIKEGKTKIAIVAQDRVVARRIRALLQRAEVFVSDETGWKLSTTRAAAAFSALFQVVTAKRKSAPLLDLLKCPFIYSEREGKAHGVMVIESTIRSGNVNGGWLPIKAAIAKYPPELEMVEGVERHATSLLGYRTIREWAQSTASVLDALNMTAALAADAAGEQILALLTTIAETFVASNQTFSLVEWRVFFETQLENASFIVPGTDTRVVMLPLNGSRMRIFDGVLVVGCDASHLPSALTETMFFANSVRRELGIATRESLQKQQMRDLAEVLMSGAEVILSRQTHSGGEVLPISPWIERLQLTLAVAGKEPIPEKRVALREAKLEFMPTLPPSPSAPTLLPETLSASGYNNFMSCPYRYFGSHMLRLRPIDDLSDEPEKREYGKWLHEILNEFHITVRDSQVNDRDKLIRAISERIFQRELKKNPSILSYYARWKKIIPTYLEWSQAREDEGWKFVAGEQAMERHLSWGGGGIKLEGRVDRLDENFQKEAAVLDYKTSSHISLTAKVKDAEDHQLPFYAILANRNFVDGRFVSLEMTDTKKGCVGVKDFAQWVTALENRIVSDMSAVKNGAHLPANGIEKVCGFCEIKGLCRKAAWQ